MKLIKELTQLNEQDDSFVLIGKGGKFAVKEKGRNPSTGNKRSKDGKDYFVAKNMSKAEAEKHCKNLGGERHGVYVVQEAQQKELDLDEKNLSVQAAKLHREFSKDKWSKHFYRKPESWIAVRNASEAIELDELFNAVQPDVVQDLKFTQEEVYGGDFDRPMKWFSKDFQAKGLDVFFIDTDDGMFVVRTEGANYARYVAFVAEDEDHSED